MYSKLYYKKHQDGSYASAYKILKYLTTFITIESIIDFGCGVGTWCSAAQNLSINNIMGVDQNLYDSSYMLIPNKNYLQRDLQKSVSLDMKMDLVISVEVGEHIESRYSHVFINTLCQHGDIILFSAALPYQGGTGHINEKPCSYWRDIFSDLDYIAIDCIRGVFWEDDDVEVWYKNNTILYVRDGLQFDILNKISSSYPIDIIHPDMLQRILLKRS